MAKQKSQTHQTKRCKKKAEVFVLRAIRHCIPPIQICYVTKFYSVICQMSLAHFHDKFMSNQMNIFGILNACKVYMSISQSSPDLYIISFILNKVEFKWSIPQILQEVGSLYLVNRMIVRCTYLNGSLHLPLSSFPWFNGVCQVFVIWSILQIL